MIEVKEILPNIIHFRFSNHKTMVRYFLRPQEYWENPIFKGKLFTHEQYKKWYISEHGIYDIEELWAGCAMSHDALMPLLNGKFERITKEEKHLIELLQPFKAKSFFVVTSVNDDQSTLTHEVAHALYAINVNYKRAVDKILKTMSSDVRHFLNKELASLEYAKFRYKDEMHAYLIDGIECLSSITGTPVPSKLVKECNRLSELLRVNYQSYEQASIQTNKSST